MEHQVTVQLYMAESETNECKCYSKNKILFETVIAEVVLNIQWLYWWFCSNRKPSKLQDEKFGHIMMNNIVKLTSLFFCGGKCEWWSGLFFFFFFGTKNLSVCGLLQVLVLKKKTIVDFTTCTFSHEIYNDINFIMLFIMSWLQMPWTQPSFNIY